MPTITLERSNSKKIEVKGKLFRKLFYECSHDLKGIVNFQEFTNKGSFERLGYKFKMESEEFIVEEEANMDSIYEKWKAEV